MRTLLCLLMLTLSVSAAVTPSTPSKTPYRFVFVPDLQAQTQQATNLPGAVSNRIYAYFGWLNSNRTDLNLKLISTVGDGVEHYFDYTNQWPALSNAVRMVATNVPTIVGHGQHDGASRTEGASDKTMATNFLASFNTNWYTSMPWWDSGGMGFYSNSCNTYITFSGGKINWLYLNLDEGPHAGIMHWASNLVLWTYPNHKVIVSTHIYMDPFEGRMSGTNVYISAYSDAYNPTNLWDKWFRKWPNLVAVVSGHMNYGATTYAAKQFSKGVHGNMVLELFGDWSNYHPAPYQIMTIYPDENRATMICTNHLLGNYSYTNSDCQYSWSLGTAANDFDSTGPLVKQGVLYGNASGLTNLPVTGLSNITDTAWTSTVRSNLYVSGTMYATGGVVSLGTGRTTIDGGLTVSTDGATPVGTYPAHLTNSVLTILHGTNTHSGVLIKNTNDGAYASSIVMLTDPAGAKYVGLFKWGAGNTEANWMGFARAGLQGVLAQGETLLFGTLDDTQLVFGQNNTERGRIYNGGGTWNFVTAVTNSASANFLGAMSWKTNKALNGSALDMSLPYQYTNAAGAITFASLSNTDDTKVQHVRLMIKSSARVAVGIPLDWATPDNATSWNIDPASGGTNAMLEVIRYPLVMTNAEMKIYR